MVVGTTMSNPTSQIIPRSDHDTGADETTSGAVEWSDIEALLRAGSGTTWLSVRTDHGVHTRPLFAAWTGFSFVIASKSTAAKTRHLEADGRVSLAIDLGTVHLVVEGTARRLTETADLERASAAMLEVYDWPTEVVGDELDAPYAAPTSGGPPFQVWEMSPARAIALPAAGQFDPTRFTFGGGR